jgi:hypothetical protein
MHFRVLSFSKKTFDNEKKNWKILDFCKVTRNKVWQWPESQANDVTNDAQIVNNDLKVLLAWK